MSTAAACFAICITLLLCKSSICASEGSALPVTLPPTIVNATTEGDCSALDAARSSHIETVQQVIRESILPILCPDCPPCVCGGQGEWVSAARLNFTDTTVDCPPNWNLVTSPVRACGPSSAGGSCDSAFFSSGGRSYSRVCGRVIGLQGGSSDAFHPSVVGNNGLEGPYIDGVSLTHGAAGSRQHIWTFASALYEDEVDQFYVPSFVCPCTNTDREWPFQVPAFVGDNYFCATGNTGPGFDSSFVYSEDPLWDGEGCGPTNACCQFNNPPYFCTTLPQATTDDLELRICRDQSDETPLVSLVNLYIM